MNVSLIIFFAIMIVASITLSIIALVKKTDSACHCPTASVGRADGKIVLKGDNTFKTVLDTLEETPTTRQITIGDTQYDLGDILRKILPFEFDCGIATKDKINWDTKTPSNIQSIDVKFTTKFTSIPKVFVTVNNTAYGESLISDVENITTTSCVIFLGYPQNLQNPPGSKVSCAWFAINDNFNPKK